MTSNLPALSSYRWSCDDQTQRIPVENPATGKILTTVQAGNARTANEAVEAAHKAYETDWRRRPPSERSGYLLRCADELEKHKDELAELVCLENGKPKSDALVFDIAFLVNSFRFFGSVADKLPTQFYDQGSVYSAVVYEPFGVCAGILPFNWPPVHTGGKLAPCLAAGNTMVLKPGDQAPLTVMRIVEIVNIVLPPDVVHAVPGVGPEVPNALVINPLVKKVSFTGSTAAGAAVGKSAADTITPTVMELGGKNAFIVFDDADLDQAVRDALEGAFFNKGEACTASSRIIVQDGIYDRFVAKLSAGVLKLRTGSGLDNDTHVGPCVSKPQQQKVLGYIKLGQEEGAEIAAQAELPRDPACASGFFVPPTLFKNVKRTMRIAQEEMFGPVATVMRFTTEDEAISVTNESPYGLVAAVYTESMTRGLRCVRRVDVGMAFLNNYNRRFLGTPFGGVKHSGHGREHCIETLYEWTTAKNIRMPSGLGKHPVWKAVVAIFGDKGTEVKV